MVSRMTALLITISLPQELIARIDEAAIEEYASRSEFIRRALVDRLQTVDECRARLAAALRTDIPTEEELFRLLRIRQGQFYARVLRREMRRRP